MGDTYITDSAKLVEQLARFTSFITHKDGRQAGFISFRDSNSFLGREEDYKSRIAEDARKELSFGEWKESWIGTGKIAACASKAISKAGNLVNMNQQIDFKNRLTPEHAKYKKDAERVLYNIYRNSSYDESTAFADAVETFGGKYDTIAFLFFIKDDSRFLPISPGHFDAGFAELNIEYTTSHNCKWSNYQGYIAIISEIRAVMEDMLPMQGTPRLIDAHSFVWVIQEERYRHWAPNAEQSTQIEQAAEEYVHSIVSGEAIRRQITSNVFARSAEVIKETKKRAKGICQFCNQPAPFIDKNGNPYLEVHHIVWLSRGGKDSISNTAALCPNCHKRMHILDRAEDTEKMLSIISDSMQATD